MSETTVIEPAPIVPIEELTPEVTDEQLKHHLQIQVVDETHGVASEAQDYAAERINRETEQGNRVTRFLRRVWKGNLAKDYYTTKYQQQGRDQIAEEGNLGALRGGSQTEHEQTSAAVIERVTSDFLHDKESQRSLSEVHNGAGLETELKNLVHKFAEDRTMTPEALAEGKARLLKEFGRGLHKAERNKGLLLADNVIEIAHNARAARDHGIGIDRIDAALTAKHADVKMGARTEAHFNMVDRVVDRVYKSKIGALFNETTIAAAVSVPYVMGKFATRKLLSTTALALAPIPGVTSAVVAGVRESFHIKQDRRTHSREMAVGGGDALSTSGSRREKMESTRYATVAAQELIGDLGRARESAGTDVAGLRDAVNALVHARTRVSLSDEKSIDLIQYSSRNLVEGERLQLDISMAEARAAVQKALTNASDDVLRGSGATNPNGEVIRDVGDLIKAQSATVLERLNGDISTRDQAFRKLQRNSVLKAATIGLVTGETIGLGIQEVKAELNDSLRGVFENSHGDQDRRTALAALFRSDGSTSSHHEIVDHGAGSLHNINAHAKLDIPHGYHLHHDGGKYELLDAHNKVIDNNVMFNEHGHLTAATKEALKNQGFNFSEHAQNVHGHDTVSHHNVHKSPAEYIHDHKQDFTKVHREVWYDNDTPNVYDKDELKLWWGGQNGINEHGDYVYSVAHMNPDGSYNGDLSANYQHLLHEGKLGLALSVTEGTQDHTIMIHFNEHGQAIINKHSFAGRELYASHDGQAQFNGAYAEVVQLGDVHHGVQSINMLATQVGENNIKTIVDHVPTVHHHMHEVVTTTLTPPVETVVSETPSLPVELPGAIPIIARRGLEYPVPEEGGYGYYYGYGESSGYWKRWNEERSPRLRKNPDADLNTGEELAWYRTQQAKLKGEQYVAEIDDYINNSEALKAIDDNTKAVVCIPVAAANESENIYKTLKLFAEQPDEAARNSTVVLLNLNWKQSLESNPEEMAKIQKTLSEVARAQAELPGIKIAAFTKVWTDDLVQRKKGKIYGEVIKVLYDTAALAIDKAVKDGRRQASTEALLITNDADTMGMGQHYLRNYLKAFDEHSKVDVFSATIRRGTKSYKEFPGYGVVSDFYAYLNMMTQRQQKVGNGGFTTEGPNSGVRMSMYAAIGGVEDRVGAGADAVLGHRIRAARRKEADLSLWKRLARRKPVPGSDRVIGSYVGGAQVDTLPDRLLGAYRQGKWIARGWDQFDADGYEGREVSMAAGELDREDPRTDMDAIAERIKVSVEGFAANWYRDPGVVSTALRLTFGMNTKDRKLYEYTWDRSKKGDGAFTFSLTEEGKEELKNRLLRDRRGRYDPYGNRLGRQLYNETSEGAAKAPKRATARLLS